jgi:hypothetical protein
MWVEARGKSRVGIFEVDSMSAKNMGVSEEDQSSLLKMIKDKENSWKVN